MALPTSRNKTYAIGDEIRAADLDDIQDQIIALYAGKHGQRQLLIPFGHDGSTPFPPAVAIDQAAVAGPVLSYAPIRLAVGEQIVSWSVWGQVVSGGDQFRVALQSQPANSLVATTIGSGQDSGTTAATFYEAGEDLSATPETAVNDTFYFVKATALTGISQLTMAKVVIQWP